MAGTWLSGGCVLRRTYRGVVCPRDALLPGRIQSAYADAQRSGAHGGSARRMAVEPLPVYGGNVLCRACRRVRRLPHRTFKVGGRAEHRWTFVDSSCAGGRKPDYARRRMLACGDRRRRDALRVAQGGTSAAYPPRMDARACPADCGDGARTRSSCSKGRSVRAACDDAAEDRDSLLRGVAALPVGEERRTRGSHRGHSVPVCSGSSCRVSFPLSGKFHTRAAEGSGRRWNAVPTRCGGCAAHAATFRRRACRTRLA